MEEIKPVVTEKNEFEYKSFQKTEDSFFALAVCQDSNALKKASFLRKHCFTSLEFSIKIFMQDIKPAVKENYEFEYWDESFFERIFSYFGLSGSWCRNKTESKFNRIFLDNCEDFIWEHDKRIQAAVKDKHEIEYLHEFNFFLAFSDYQHFDARIKRNDFLS